MKLIDGFDSNYRYILVAARRARQLHLHGFAKPGECQRIVSCACDRECWDSIGERFAG